MRFGSRFLSKAVFRKPVPSAQSSNSGCITLLWYNFRTTDVGPGMGIRLRAVLCFQCKGLAALTGRNIVCGSGTFLYYHGIDYAGRNAELPIMYADPAGNQDLYKKYNVDYVYVSDTERESYQVNEDALTQIATCIYNENNVRIYKVNGQSTDRGIGYV